MNELLKDHYSVRLLNSGVKALKLLENPDNNLKIDLLLLDVMMPEMDGYEVCERLRANPSTRHLPVIFLTAKDRPEDEQKALAVGGNDFITKPINPDVLLSRMQNQLALREYSLLLQDQNAQLEQRLEQKLSDLFKLQQATMTVMISLAEFRDEVTGNHIKRTQAYVKCVLDVLKETDQELSDERCEWIVQAAPLHDIGKITTPDHILLKPGKLTSEEFEVMKLHAQKGAEILNLAAAEMGDYGDFLVEAQAIAMSHHEKWDGSGYPKGLKGDDIPIGGRIMAIADVYDALRSERPYKSAMTHDKAISIIKLEVLKNTTL